VSANGRTFRYPLEPLRKKREWERDALGHALARLDAVLAWQRERLARAEELFSRARAEWRLRVRADRTLDLNMQRVLSVYLAHAGRALESHQKEMDGAQKSRAAAADKLMKAQQLLDGVERLKTRLAQVYRRGELAREYKDVDAAWVQRAALKRGGQ